jgi:hypothetical protein
MGPSRQTPFLAYFGILVSFWFDFHPHPARWTRRDSLIWFWIWEILKLPHVFNPIANRNVHGLSLSLCQEPFVFQPRLYREYILSFSCAYSQVCPSLV